MNVRLPIGRKKHNYALISFLMGILLACTFFVPYIIIDGGLFLFYGDFNAQQIPFYQMTHDSLLNGDTMWSNTTDLGANLIGSYSFYLMGSPFFWITMLFPSSVVPYLMAPLMILKFGCASLTAYLYLRRYVTHKGFAVIGGLLYAFSGFSIYNVFFNHFHEAIIIFPLLLFAIDEYMYSKKKGLVALTVFGACILNYYFFVGQVVFIIMYWVIRICTKSYPKISFKELLFLAFEVIIGFMMTAVILLPAILSVIQNNRLSTWPDGWNSVVYDKPQRYINIVETFFFPPDIAARPNFTPDSDNNWGSVAAWLPLVGMTGVIGFLQNIKQHWLKKVLPLLFVITMVPLFNALFQGLNMNYYARWFYILDLMMILATVKAFEDNDIDWLKATRLSAGISVVILCIIGLMPYTSTSEDVQKTKIGLENYPERLWIYGAIALTGICAFVLIIKLFKNNPKKFIKVTIASLSVVIIIYSNFIMYLGRLQTGNSADFLKDYGINAGDNIQIEDIKEVRSDFYECTDNLGMYWQIPNIQAFHSIVPGSIMDFYPEFGTARDVASRPEVNLYGLRSLLSVKYLFDDPTDDDNFYKNDEMLMPYWKYSDTLNGVNVYENECYIPMGFMYDEFISKDEFEMINTEEKHLAILKAMVLDKKQLKKYKSITKYSEDDFSLLTNNSDSDSIYQGKSNEFVYSNEQYKKDCKKLKSQSCHEFKYINNGFTAKIKNTGDENLLFFSVPYEDGWTAYVNGKETKIEKVNIGMMAVVVPANTESKIEFRYYTPGLTSGITITIISGIIFILYISAIYFFGFGKVKRKNHREDN